MEKVQTQPNRKFLYFTAITANLIAFASGITFAWTSPVIPRLNGDVDPANNPVGAPISSQEESWIASILNLGAALGPLAAGFGADKIGRKRTLLLLSLPIMAAFIMTALAHNVLLFYLARFLMGISSGGIFTVLPMFLSEIAENHNRGLVSCLLGVFVSSGLVFAYAVGPFLSVKYFSIVCLTPIVIFIPIFGYFAPETPQFYAMVQQRHNLEISLAKLRNKSPKELEKELLEIENQVADIKGKHNCFELFKSRSLRNGLIVSIGLVILQQLAGINPVLSYMQSIFGATGSSIPPEIATIIVGSVQALTTILTSSIVDKLGRRILLITSSIGVTIALVSLGTYFYLATNHYDVTLLYWLPVLSLLLYVFFFNLGLGPLPWTVMAEIFPPDYKSTASTMTTIVCFMAAFIITFIFPLIAPIIGMAQTFWAFSVCSMGAGIFIYWAVPETKGRSLQQIQKLLTSRKKQSNIQS